MPDRLPQTLRRVCCVLLIALVPTVVRAHAILKSASPAAGEVVSGSDLSIQLRFTSRIDGKRSRVLLVAPDGAANALPIADQTSPDTLDMKASGLKSGEYSLRWQVLANDGHITRGEIPFHVK